MKIIRQILLGVLYGLTIVLIIVIGVYIALLILW